LEPDLKALSLPATLVALCVLLSGCEDGRPAAERVEVFCSGIQQGENINAVSARYEEFDLQPGGFAPDPAERLSAIVTPEILLMVSGTLAEPSGSPAGARPVCAIYYSNRLKGGDDKVILAEFKREWAHRH